MTERRPMPDAIAATEGMGRRSVMNHTQRDFVTQARAFRHCFRAGHSRVVRLYANNWVVFRSTDLSTSFTDVPTFVLRNLVSECSKSQTDSHALSPSPTLFTHTRVTHRRLEESEFTFYDYDLPFHIPVDIKFVCIPTALSIRANFHQDFALTKGFASPCSKNCGVEQR
ncbi:hypothetical protein AVEN_21964-1 [Araneus ventricosus]|uniref:Uncharacterized protein n=1 Tax=Araneus ventricosus TaxID=182803 RepID=A0A4Y2NKI7_ARAVE|nr:hypothetical protein AVEN_21964-1 [Araneus ventricosus]